ncbi:MAG: Lrp/AsnC ligand binding domain-containing protein [Muribaculaceae bacterium]|nr:Lrp/AsnC ligand binding domain-containing protein [Muribaculaceae bacterium]
MPRSTYDSLDLKILSMLSKNARTPYLEIARECGVSGAAVHQRIQRLLSNDTIAGSECIISPHAMGFDTCAYIGIFLHDPSQYDAVVEALEAIPEVVECHYTAGKYDILVKVFAHNNDHLLSILQNIQNLGLARTETLISFKQCFRRQVPTPPPGTRKKN